MSVYEKIDEMSNRLIQGKPRHISNRIILYSEGVKAKLKNADYALSMITELSPQSDNLITSDSQSFCINDKIQFYVDSFFAFLYSTFDIISHVINQEHRLALDEKDVSFKRVKRNLNQSHQGTNIRQLFNKLSGKVFFKNLDKYRNCSTHRRQIFIETIIRTGTVGYSTTGDFPEVYRWICDDPLSLKPRTKKERVLVDYCKDMLNKVKSEIINISENIGV